MSQANDLHTFVDAFVDELARCGLRYASVCPGSRSTPLAVLLYQHPAIKVWMHLDERSAAYFALGQAKATRQPVAVLGTSGTAALNFAPAVVEAFYARVPLLVLTADRPPELQAVGAPQTIDQSRLYGRHVKRCIEMPLPEGGPHAVRYVRTTASRAMADCSAERPGPVHVNFPFREPLIPSAKEQDERKPDTPHVAVTQGLQALRTADATELAARLRGAQRGLIVCGPQDDPGFPDAVVRLSRALQFPILADVLSQVRCGAHDLSYVIDRYDAFLRDSKLVRDLVPDLVLRFGATPVSKPLQLYLQSLTSCRQLLIAPADDWYDPALVATDRVQADPLAFCEALIPHLGNISRRGIGTTVSAWCRMWEGLNAQTRTVLQEHLNVNPDLSEPQVFTELNALLPPNATLFAGNSMPVRDLDTFFAADARPARFLANRGASGIDGVVSTALGVSSVNSGPCVLVIGDLSLYHDMNGLLAAKQHGLQATIVLLHNDGGGIFSFLPQAEAVESFEGLFGTPHGLDFRYAAQLYGLDYCEPEDGPAFRIALEKAFHAPGVSLIVVHTNRDANARLHRELWQAVSQRIRSITPQEPASCALP